MTEGTDEWTNKGDSRRTSRETKNQEETLNRLQIKTKNTISSFDEIAVNNY